jgi:hypothetical protein
MVSKDQVIAQLKNLGISVKGWGAAEIHELPHILLPNEQITHLVNGWYENGFATLVSTNMRLLLVDKKLFNLTLEDVRYDMIAEVDYNSSVMDATICISTVNKKLTFTSFRQQRLRSLTNYVQHRVMDLRQHYSWAQFEETPIEKHNPQLQSFFNESNLTSNLPMQQPIQTPMKMPTPMNPYAKGSLTTKHNTFLPRIPRRWRPTVETQP